VVSCPELIGYKDIDYILHSSYNQRNLLDLLVNYMFLLHIRPNVILFLIPKKTCVFKNLFEFPQPPVWLLWAVFLWNIFESIVLPTFYQPVSFGSVGSPKVVSYTPACATPKCKMKYVVITGGVVSGLGKGITIR
jgi:hypothetical protein